MRPMPSLGRMSFATLVFATVTFKKIDWDFLSVFFWVLGIGGSERSRLTSSLSSLFAAEFAPEQQDVIVALGGCATIQISCSSSFEDLDLLQYALPSFRQWQT